MEKDIVPELLEKIQKEFHENFSKSEKIKALEAKVRDGTATYIEIQRYAEETGDILAQVFKKHITEEVLPDGRMYYNIAQRILQPTLGENHKLITDITTQVQNALNKKAGLGIKAIVPELNQERVDGLVNHLDHAKSFEEVARTLDEPIKQHAMSIVSDAIEANAKFQYDAGLQPMIVREAEHKCCEWCSRLEGSFKYPDEVPADIYRRHDRCRCTVDYVVGKTRRNIHSKRSKTQREQVESVLKFQEIIPDAFEDVRKEYLKSTSKRNFTVQENVNISREKSAISNAKILSKLFGGDITVLEEKFQTTGKNPDYLWNGKYWEHKELSSVKAVDSAVRSATKQIAKNPGGIVLDISKIDAPMTEIYQAIESRIRRRGYDETIDVILINNSKVVSVIRHKK